MYVCLCAYVCVFVTNHDLRSLTLINEVNRNYKCRTKKMIRASHSSHYLPRYRDMSKHVIRNHKRYITRELSEQNIHTKTFHIRLRLNSEPFRQPESGKRECLLHTLASHLRMRVRRTHLHRHLDPAHDRATTALSP